MTIEDTKEFMKRIKQHYQEFSVDNYKIDEWYRELKNYDLEDLDRKLEDHLKSEQWGQSIPKLYFLTKYLMTSEEKKSTKTFLVSCPNCQKVINYNNWDKHIERCNSVEYLNKQSIRFFGKEIDRDKYMTMSDENFEEKYLMTLDLIKEKGNDEVEKKRIKNIKRTMLGGKVEFTPDLYVGGIGNEI